MVTVVGTDHFGNLQLGARREDLTNLGAGLGSQLRLLLDSGETHLATHACTFSNVGESELLVFEDSSWQLALGCNRGSAAARLGLRGGDRLRISALPEP